MVIDSGRGETRQLVPHTSDHVVAWTLSDCSTSRAHCTTPDCDYDLTCDECLHLLHVGEPCDVCREWGEGPCG